MDEPSVFGRFQLRVRSIHPLYSITTATSSSGGWTLLWVRPTTPYKRIAVYNQDGEPNINQKICCDLGQTRGISGSYTAYTEATYTHRVAAQGLLST